uniref:Uncharacterized protein n=1 Tax=Ditylenchus dipsaci TaxID=166011 RepID=A0A915DF05_9BILA
MSWYKITFLFKVDQTEEITSSKADRLTSTTASKSRSRCAGDKKLSPLVVPAMVKSAEESANQPSVVSSPAVFKECFDQSSVFQPASAESVVLCSNLKPADASIPDEVGKYDRGVCRYAGGVGRYAEGVGRYAGGVGRYAREEGRYARIVGRYARGVGKYDRRVASYASAYVVYFVLVLKSWLNNSEAEANSLLGEREREVIGMLLLLLSFHSFFSKKFDKGLLCLLIHSFMWPSLFVLDKHYQ